VRLSVGIPLYLLVYVSMSLPALGLVLGITAPIAWFVASLFDPKRSATRMLAWVIAGTLVSFAMNWLGVSLLGFGEMFFERPHVN
jgi:hypothetical protein